MLTAIEKKTTYAEVLLRHGATPNIQDEKSGRTALFHAVENDADNIIKLLLKYKADPKLVNYLGISAVDAARDIYANTKYAFNLEYSNYINTSDNASSSKKRSAKSKQDKNKPKKIKMSFITSLKKIEDI